MGDWQAFEEASVPDVVSTRSEFVQAAADAGLESLAELFPAAKSFADIVARLQDKQAGSDNWIELVEDLFEATDTSFVSEHDFAFDGAGAGLGEALDQLRQLLDDQAGDSVSDQPDLQPMYAGTVEGGTASGSPVGFNQAMVDQIDSGSYWYNSGGQVAPTISYGFTTSNSFASGFGEQSGWSTFTSAQKDAAREIMGLWDDLVAPSFVEDTGSPNTADIKFSNSTTNTGFAHAYYPGQVDAEAFQFQKIQGSVWLNPNYNSGVNNLVTPTSGVYGYTAIAHEVGHALGLNHAGNYNGGSPQYGNGSTGWLYEEDSSQYTIMSYFNASYTGAAWNGKNAQTPMVYDVLAIQQMYGADYTTRAGDTIYGFNSTAGNWIYDYNQNTTPVMTIWDGDGTDTIDLSGWSTSSTLSLAAGSYSSVNNMTYNLAIAYDVDIENAIGGSGDDTLDGNDLDNVITGNAGEDTINGHFGNDTLYGGDDNDTLNGGEGNDWLEGGDGVDKLFGGDGNDTIVYDAADDFAFVDGGDGLDTLLFYDLWLNIDLTAYNFEQSQVQTTDAGSAAWDIQTDTYDINGNLFERRITNDNGTSSLTVYDVYDVESWSEWTRDFNAAGDQINETFIDDGSGGANTPAIIAGDDEGAVTEDATSPVLTDSGALTISDADAGQASFVAGTVAGTYGSVNITAAGNWTYTATNNQSAIQSLGAGATLTDTITVSSADGTTHDISVTITGVDDATTISGDDEGAVTEDATSPVLTDSGTLTISDVDAGQASFVAGTVAGTYGSVNITAAGNWTYTATNNQSAIQSLGAGATLTDTITVSSADGTTHDISVTITGVDDATTISGDDEGAVTEDATTPSLTDSGALTISDADAGQASFVAGTVAGTYGSVSITAAGNWTYTAANSQSAIQALGAGATLTDTITVSSVDGTTHEISVTITGVDDVTGVDDANVIESNGANQLTVNAGGAYQISDGVGTPVVLKYNGADVGPASFAGWSAIQAEATATGLKVLWYHEDAGYGVWETDATGAYESSYGLQESELTELETLFAADLDGDGRVGVGVIEDNGALQLATNTSGAYQVNDGEGTPVVLKYNGADVGPASFAGWSAIQAEATATGLKVLWRHEDGGYGVWETDAAGAYESSYGLQESELTELETLFAADLDGDGAVGVIEDNGALRLALNTGGAYQVSDGVGTPVVLKYNGADVGPASFAGWSAIQAEATATGLTVLWHHEDGGYGVWETDAAGVYESSYGLQESELTELETLFAADLDGDGGVGVIGNNGALQLALNPGGAYQVSDGAGTPVVLKYNGADVGPASFAGWSAVQAEATATGMKVVWHHDDGMYLVWETDAAGIYEGSYNLQEADVTELETLFAADLDGDGGVGVIEDSGAFQLAINTGGAYQVSNGDGSPVVLEYNNADVGPNTLAGWSAVQAEATDSGFVVLWNHDDDSYGVWETDLTGAYENSYAVPESQLTGLETLFAADLNGDGGIGLV
ncbi:MAG: VCBS domain-containing protein [Anderseniella sp.]